MGGNGEGTGGAEGEIEGEMNPKGELINERQQKDKQLRNYGSQQGSSPSPLLLAKVKDP